MYDDPIDYSLASERPAPLFIGELPRRYEDIPSRVVINVCGAFPSGEPWGRVVLALPMIDALDPAMLPSRQTVERFLATVHPYAADEPTYWHCHAGLNRSGLMVASYLHLYRGFRISDAIAHLRAARSPMVLCNSFFEQTLRQWYGAPEEQAFEPFSLEKYLAERAGRGRRS